MDDKLQQAYAALQAAHDAGNTADATQLADYIETLQGQQETTSAAAPSSEVRTGAALPAIGGALGATVGTAAAIGSKGKNIYNAISKMGSAPPASTGYNPRGSSVEESVQNWRTYADAQNEAAKSVRRDSELHKKYPGFTRPNLPHLQPVVPTTSQNILGHAANLGTNRPLTGLTAGANALDLAQQVRADNPVQATVSGLGLLGSAAPYVKKLPKQLRGAGMAASAAAPVINRLLDQLTNPPEEKAAGGLIQHYDVGSSVKAGASQVKKYSDIIQHHIGKMLHPTIVDTTKLDLAAGKMAGNEASNLQNISKPHKKEDWVFANDSMSAAKRLWNVNQRNNGNVVNTGLLGSPYQLKTNRSVFGDLEDEFYKAIAAGKLDPDLLKKYQTALAASTHKSKDEIVQTFPNKFDIRDRDAFKENSKLFHQRGALADIMGGSGPTGVPLGGKKGQIFDWEDVLNASRDPNTIGAPTQSIGTRLFSINDRPPEYRPDLHNAFDYSLFGKDFKESFAPVPKEIGYPDAIEAIRQNNIAKGKKPDVTTMHIGRNIITQPITEEYVKAAQAAGFADGGSVLPNVSLDTRNIPSISGMPGVGYMQTPQGAMARLQLEKELEEARIRAGISGMAMSIPGMHGVKTMPGQMDVGANMPVGPGRLDVSANRSINPIPGKGHMQGVNARYTIPFAEGGEVAHLAGGGDPLKGANVVKHSISQIPQVAQALEAYLKGNITKAQHMEAVRKHLPIRQWNELPPEYTDEQIRNALRSNQLDKALAPVPVGKETGNRLDINAYTNNNPPVFVDTVHDINDNNKVLSYNRTGHLKDVNFKSLPNSAVMMGLGTKEQALTPMGAQMGKSKAPIAMIEGTNVGTHDDEVRRMMAEMIKDPRYTQIGMDPRVGSQFYDKSTDRPIWTSGEKFQVGPLVMVPKKDIETTDWNDPRLLLKKFPGKTYKKGGLAILKKKK
jgi:hypothetical protein